LWPHLSDVLTQSVPVATVHGMLRTELPDEMSDYERDAWRGLQRQAAKRINRRSIKPEYRAKVASIAKKVTQPMARLPMTDVVGSGLDRALVGLRGVTLDAAMRTVRAEGVRKRFAAHGVTLEQLEDARALDLQVCDRTRPPTRAAWTAVLMCEGAATSMFITGAEVSTTVTGGATAAGVVGAIAADTAAVLAGLGRIIAETGAYYGYDTRRDDEQLFALSVLGYSSSMTPAGKVAALGELSRLSQTMMRRATWATLNKEPIVRVIHQVYARLGLRLTKAGLAKAVPFVGVMFGMGLNASAAQRVAEDAAFAYRTRFLIEKYNLDPANFYQIDSDAETTSSPSQTSEDDDVIDIMGTLESDPDYKG
jgi:hypothetical protein